ncbi:hypothetical protein GF327_05650 [Candidatus Woesearchaeota archaeon]|nr:hypothetical protein [Candidatus Woesearchaeota archaeon]
MRIKKIANFFYKSRIIAASGMLPLVMIFLFFNKVNEQILLRVFMIFLVNYHIFLYNDYGDRFEDDKCCEKKKKKFIL